MLLLLRLGPKSYVFFPLVKSIFNSVDVTSLGLTEYQRRDTPFSYIILFEEALSLDLW